MIRLLIIFVSVLTLNLSAQTFGLKGGLAITNNIGSDVENNSPKMGFYFGGFMQLAEGNNIQYMPQVLFHQKGSITNIDFLGQQYKSEAILNYIDLGINAHFHINDEFALVVGPYFGYLASAVEKEETPSGNQSQTVSDWDGWNRSEFGANLGANYQINDLFKFNIHYGLSFTDILEETSIRNTSIQLGVGYIFSY